MYNLILKDILIQKKMILLSFLYVVFFIIAMQGAGLVIYPMAVTALTYMLVLTSCAYDDKNKADVMLNSLPLKRYNIVLAKYLSIFVYIAIGTIVYYVTTTLVYLTGLPVKTSPISLEGLAGTVLSIIFLNSIYYPFYFKLGYVKSRFVSLILFFSVFFGLTNALTYIYANRDVAWVKSIEKYLQPKSDIEIMAIISGFVLVIWAASFLLSLKAYQNRDF